MGMARRRLVSRGQDVVSTCVFAIAKGEKFPKNSKRSLKINHGTCYKFILQPLKSKTAFHNKRFLGSNIR